MSDHFSEWLNLLPFAVVGASVLGSAHCVAMCGGLVLSVAKDRKSLIAYHLGRLLSYCALGALAGLAGERAFALSDSLGWVAAGALSVVLIFMGVRVWRGENVHLFRTPGWILNRAFRGAAQDPFLVGLFSGLLPCGWLHLFVVGALATRSAPLGAIYLFFFWLGTLPAMSASPGLIRALFRPMARKAPRTAAIVLILIGIGNVGLKLMPVLSSPQCPLHMIPQTQISGTNEAIRK